jgi:copper homeostasis protein
VPVLVEACIDSVRSALAAERAGAGRVELCAALHDAGTTPSAGMIAAVKGAVRIPVFVLVRPRGGDFAYTDAELDVMRRDVEAAARLGADGIVTGALRPDGRVDDAALGTLSGAAGPLPVTFHRAFDLTPDPLESLETLAGLGVRRVLTSGGAPTAREGADMLAALVARAAGRIGILAGGGLREDHVGEVVRRSGVTEIHVRGSEVVRSGAAREAAAVRTLRLRKALPEDESAWEETAEARMRGFVAAAGS